MICFRALRYVYPVSEPLLQSKMVASQHLLSEITCPWYSLLLIDGTVGNWSYLVKYPMESRYLI